MATYPYSIDNGSGEALTFLGVVRAPDADRVEAEGLAQPGAGPPIRVEFGMLAIPVTV